VGCAIAHCPARHSHTKIADIVFFVNPLRMFPLTATNTRMTSPDRGATKAEECWILEANG
jgi:hypothetical protein